MISRSLSHFIVTATILFCACNFAISQEQETVLKNADVVEMVKIGLSEGIILAKIRQTKSEFDTSLEALAKLKEFGVSESVTIAMIEAGKKESQSDSGPVLDNMLGRVEDAVGKKKVFVESLDEKATQEIVQILTKNGFSLVPAFSDADLLIKLTSAKVARTMGTGGLIMMTNTADVDMGKLSVYVLNENIGKLIYQKERKNTFPAKHLYTQARSFMEDFMDDLKKAEKKSGKKN